MSRLTWSTNVAGDPKLTGCNPNFVFTTTGGRWLTLTGVDVQGLSAKTATLFNIADPPPGSGPFVTITSPDDGSVFLPNQPAPLVYAVSNAAGGVAPAPVWNIDVGGQQIPVKVHAAPSPGLPPTWTAFDYQRSTCGTSAGTLWLYFTDGAGKDHYGPRKGGSEPGKKPSRSCLSPLPTSPRLMLDRR